MIDLDRRSLLKAVATASALGILGEGVSPALEKQREKRRLTERPLGDRP